MDTEKFIKKCNSKDIGLAVTNFFNEIMVLYNLMNHYEDFNILVEGDDHAIFTIESSSIDNLHKIYKSLNLVSFTVYDTKYNIFMTLNETNIVTKIYKATS